jgi:hypothetical protein
MYKERDRWVVVMAGERNDRAARTNDHNGYAKG